MAISYAVSTGQGASRPYTYHGSDYRRVGNATLAVAANEYKRMLFERMHSGSAGRTGPPPDSRGRDRNPVGGSVTESEEQDHVSRYADH